MVNIKRIPPRYQLLFMAIPFIILIFLFQYVPLFGWTYALFDYIPGVPLLECDFVGFEFFTYIFFDTVNILRVLKNTLIFASLSLVLSLAPPIFAICLNEIQSSGFKRIVQTLTTLPNFISMMIVYSISFIVFSSDGLINTLMMSLGVITQPTNVMGNGDTIYIFLTLLGLWKGLGWSSIVYFAAIAGVDHELYDAAAIDGAGYLVKARHITLPALMPTYFVLLILSISNFLNTGFEQYFLFKNPLTANNIEVLDLYTYRIGLVNNDYSYGIAIGIMKTFISLTLLSIANQASKKVLGRSIF